MSGKENTGEEAAAIGSPHGDGGPATNNEVMSGSLTPHSREDSV